MIRRTRGQYCLYITLSSPGLSRGKQLQFSLLRCVWIALTPSCPTSCGMMRGASARTGTMNWTVLTPLAARPASRVGIGVGLVAMSDPRSSVFRYSRSECSDSTPYDFSWLVQRKTRAHPWKHGEFEVKSTSGDLDHSYTAPQFYGDTSWIRMLESQVVRGTGLETRPGILPCWGSRK